MKLNRGLKLDPTQYLQNPVTPCVRNSFSRQRRYKSFDDA